MAAVFFTKSSGVITITQTTGRGKSYFGLVGSYMVNPAGDGFNILNGKYKTKQLRYKYITN